MTNEDLFLIGDRAGFTPAIGRLVSMMGYARHTTLAELEGLTVEQLDHLQDEASNSIGALLLHVAAVETWYQARTFERRELDREEMGEWEAALDLGDRARREIRARDAAFYRSALERVRARTLAELARRDDAWLEERSLFGGGRPANNHFLWFHVMEDELNHRGQIRWLRKRVAIRRR